MSPAIKYTLGRIGLFLIVFAVLFPTPLNILVKAMIAFAASAAFAFFLLRGWRDQMAEHLAQVASRRSAEKARLRSALAGDDEAAEAGDRVAAADAKSRAAVETKAGTKSGADDETKSDAESAEVAGAADTDEALKSEHKSDAGK